MRPPSAPSIADTALSLVGSALSVRLHAELGRPDRARVELHRALDLLADLDDRLSHELHDPLGARASGPRQIGDPPVSYLGQDAADLAADRKAAAALGVRPGPLDPPATPTQLLDKHGNPLPAEQQPPGGHVADTTSATRTGSAG